jgi:hypothetical protein
VGEGVHGVEVDGLGSLADDELVFLEAVGLLVVRLLQVQLQKLPKHYVLSNYYNPQFCSIAHGNAIPIFLSLKARKTS